MMTLDDITFLGMNIVKETQKFVESFPSSTTEGMTESELAAYNMGIINTLGALQALMGLDVNEIAVIHMEDTEMPTEITIDELIGLYEEQTGNWYTHH